MGADLLFGDIGDVSVKEPVPTQRHVVVLAAPKGVSDEAFRTIVQGYYTAYTMDGKHPTVERLRYLLGGRYPKAKIAKCLESREFKTAMAHRGVSLGIKDGLTAQQMYCLQILTNPTDRRDLKLKLKSAGITYPTYRGWLRQPLFADYLHNITEGMLKEHVPDFNTVLTNRALSGDMNALKFAYELSGRHDPNHQQVLDLQVILGALMEIITKNVKDPDVLRQISAELQLTLVSKNVIKGEISNGNSYS